MKTTILSMILTLTGFAMIAQVPTDTLKTTISTSGDYKAYSVAVPTEVEASFMVDYPTATNVTWRQSGDWYKATYMENGRYTHTHYNVNEYYNRNGSSFKSSLPVLRTFVPEEVISKATQMYGPDIYAIAATKGTDGEMVYNVTVIDNANVSRTEWMGEDGSSIRNPYMIMEVSKANEPGNSETLTNSSNSVEEVGEVENKDETATGNEVNNTNHMGTTDESTNEATNQPTSDNGPNAPVSGEPVSYEMINNSTTSEDMRYMLCL